MPDLTACTVTPDDTGTAEAYLEVANAVRVADSPWMPLRTLRELTGLWRHGWDGEPSTPYVFVLDGRPVATGEIGTSEYDNLHLAWLDVEVHPDRRRAGIGSQVLDTLLAEAKARGRTSVGIDGWDTTAASAFAARHGFDQKSVAVNRFQYLEEVDWPELERLHAVALAAAPAYQLVRRTGRTPDDELEAVAALVSAINDAPTDDLDIEDEVFTAERVRAYETAQAGRDLTVHRVLARHRETGELAGHSVVAVDQERPHLGEQHDTAVVGAHRGHRLGLLLKTDMNLWLRDIEPQVESIETWNAESNDHMISVNEQLGYRVTGRRLQFQRSL